MIAVRELRDCSAFFQRSREVKMEPAVINQNVSVPLSALQWLVASYSSQISFSHDRVFVIADNSISFFFARLIAKRIGAPTSVLDQSHLSVDFIHSLSLCKGDLVLLSRSTTLLEKFESSSAQTFLLPTDEEILNHPRMKGPTTGSHRSGPTQERATKVPAATIYSSGTTGIPKAALHDAEFSASSSLNAMLDLYGFRKAKTFVLSGGAGKPAQVFLSRIALDYGLNIAISPFERGRKLIDFSNRFESVIIHIYPEQLTSFASMDDDTLMQFARNTTRVIVGGGITPVETKARIGRIFGDKILEYYGTSEHSRAITIARGSDWASYPGSVGFASRGLDLVIRDANQDGIGLIVVRTEDAEGSIVEKPTTDLGRLDSDGRLYLSGRVEELSSVGSDTVSLKQLERKVLAVDGVADCFVYRKAGRVCIDVIKLSDSTGETLRKADVMRVLSGAERLSLVNLRGLM